MSRSTPIRLLLFAAVLNLLTLAAVRVTRGSEPASADAMPPVTHGVTVEIIEKGGEPEPFVVRVPQ